MQADLERILKVAGSDFVLGALLLRSYENYALYAVISDTSKRDKGQRRKTLYLKSRRGRSLPIAVRVTPAQFERCSMQHCQEYGRHGKGGFCCLEEA